MIALDCVCQACTGGVEGAIWKMQALEPQYALELLKHHLVNHHGWQIDEAAGDEYSRGNDYTGCDDYSGGVEDNDTENCIGTVTVDEEDGELIVSLPDVHSQHKSVRGRDTHNCAGELQLHEGHDQPVHEGANAAHGGKEEVQLGEGEEEVRLKKSLSQHSQGGAAFSGSTPSDWTGTCLPSSTSPGTGKSMWRRACTSSTTSLIISCWPIYQTNWRT